MTTLGHYRDNKSKILTNLIVFLSPIELIVYSFQAYYIYENRTMKEDNTALKVFYTTIVSTGGLLVTNILGLAFYLNVLKKDEGFKAYKSQHSKLVAFIVVISSIFSFKLLKIFSSRLFGMPCFSSQVKNYSKTTKVMNLLVLINMILTLLSIISIDVYGLS